MSFSLWIGHRTRDTFHARTATTRRAWRRTLPARALHIESLEDRTLLDSLPLGPVLPVRINSRGIAALSGFLSTSTPTNLYALPLTTGDTITADVDSPTSGSPLSYVLRVLSGLGTALASARGSSADPGHLLFHAPAAVTYYLAVSAVRSATAPSGEVGSSTGLYQLTLSQTQRPLSPNLVGTSFQLDRDAALWGDRITVHYSIENHGGAPVA